MPYHRVTIINKQTGKEEHFLARISPQGFAEWLAEREALTAAGNPDRPPDVDTDTLRAWVPWPGEENLPVFQKWQGAEARLRQGLDAVYSVSWRRADGVTAWMAVYANLDAGGYMVGFSSTDPAYPPVSKTYPFDVPGASVWAEIEGLVEAVTGDPRWDVPKVTAYLDARAFEAELSLAEAEVAAGFMAMPEGRA